MRSVYMRADIVVCVAPQAKNVRCLTVCVCVSFPGVNLCATFEERRQSVLGGMGGECDRMAGLTAAADGLLVA